MNILQQLTIMMSVKNIRNVFTQLGVTLQQDFLFSLWPFGVVCASKGSRCGWDADGCILTEFMQSEKSE